MDRFNLLVKFTVAGDSRVHVKRATRIKLDGRGGLTLYGAHNSVAANVCLDLVQSLTIQAFPWLNVYRPATSIQ